MRIAIDYTTAIRQGAGIGTYIRCLVEALLAQDQVNRYVLLSSQPPQEGRTFPQAEHVTIRRIPIPERYLNILWYRWQLPPYANWFTGPVDLYHGPDFVLPPFSRFGRHPRTVVTIHDLAFLEYPQYAVPSLAAYLRGVVPRAARSADVVATVSQASARTLTKYLAIPPEKMVIISPGVGRAFRRVTDPVLLEATRYKYGLKHPFVLTVGTKEPRKNHLGLIRAFHQALNRKPRPKMLVIVGGPGWLYEETEQEVVRLGLTEKVRFLGHVSTLDLVMLYSMADVFAYPSFYEGFGMPALEALACGAPVVTSNTSSLPEVVGEAALKVDPYDAEALASAITRLLDDQQLCQELRQRGYEQVKRYTWEASARKMLLVYQKLYEGLTDFTTLEASYADRH
ncbi:glycosyltransferase family 4 protein [Thermogemmatispora onikobensis]|uniref:glycosyltransferase family 4 protein n=1 Tax=Thermogemmatispora onikobensis TaxID=732234 RepID=UPI00085376EC|nr:glycosyltransferase family 1 protein [Thermogemmatispora onikobensis]